MIIDHACYAGVEDRTQIYLDAESKERFAFHHLRPGRYRLWLDGEDSTSGVEVVVGSEYTPTGECHVSLID